MIEAENWESALMRLRDLYDHAPCGYHSLGKEGFLLEMNQTELDWLGYKREELIGKVHIDELLAPSCKGLFARYYGQLIKDKGVKDVEVEFLRKDGTTYFGLVNASLHVGSGGEFLGTRSSVNNINDKKMAEIKLKYSEEKVRTREELFRNLIESSSDIITLLNGDFYVSYSSPSVERILGYLPDELSNRPIYEFIHPDDLSAVVLTLSNAGTSLGEVYSEKYRSKHKDGSWKYMEATGKAMLSKETNGLVYIINSRDISDSVQTERLLQYKVNELNTFMYKATHDLRAPLSSLLGLIALAKLEKNPESLQHYFGMIDESTRKMDKILIDLVDITKIAQGVPEIGEVNLEMLVKDIVSSLENTPGYREIVFSTRLQLTRPFYSDPKLLHSILQNLLDNSAKYRSNGRKNYVEVEAEETVNGVKLYISDNGMGIAEPYQQKVFNMFYRATLQSSGTGLGLYIVKNAIEKLGGTIALESREGVGTRVTITLPHPCTLN